MWRMVQHDIENENKEGEVWVVPVAVTVTICILAIFVLISFIIYQKSKILNMINRKDWNIPIENNLFFYDERTDISRRLSGSPYWTKIIGVETFQSYYLRGEEMHGVDAGKHCPFQCCTFLWFDLPR